MLRIRDAAAKADENVDDAAVVDDMFDFLSDMSVEQQGPSLFKDLPAPKNTQDGDIIMGVPASKEDYEDLSDYKFPKFAATYFQGAYSHQYSRKPLKHSLLTLQTQGDQLAALALWITILRFMGDLPEPRYHSNDRDTTSVMTKVTATLGRNFIKSKEFQEAQMMGMDTETNGLENVNGTNGTDAKDATLAIKEKQRSIRHKLVSLTLKRKNKMGDEIKRKLQEEEYTAGKDIYNMNTDKV